LERLLLADDILGIEGRQVREGPVTIVFEARILILTVYEQTPQL
jgi:hypothetical protein